MFKRKLVLCSCLLARRDGAVIVQVAMLVSTKAKAIGLTVSRYLPENYRLLGVLSRRPYVVAISGIVPSHTPLTMGEVLDHAAKGSLVFGGIA